jgi:KDO2-lipid IV(A) lauroyltransferase
MKKTFKHRLEAGAVNILLACASVLPLWFLRLVGAALGWTAFTVPRIRRRVAVDNVCRAVGGSEGEVRAIARRSYMNLGRSMMEFAALPRMSAERIRSLVEVEGERHFADVAAAGRGAVLVTGHFGNWELIAAWLGRSRFPFNVLVGRQSNSQVDRIINRLREKQGIRVIPYQASLRGALRALENKEFVAVLADQDARRKGVFVDFLGRPASTIREPARLAIRLGCPIISGVVIRLPGGRHRAEILPPLWPDPDRSQEEAILELTQRFTANLERYVRQHPDQYFWAHRRWKTQPENQPAPLGGVIAAAPADGER